MKNKQTHRKAQDVSGPAEGSISTHGGTATGAARSGTIATATRSILPPEFQGVMSITGYRGIGKSLLAAQADVPPNIAFLDFESKGEGIHRQLSFGLYRALTQEAGSGLELYALLDRIVDDLSDLGSNNFTVVVLDNVQPLEQAIMADAKKRPAHYAERYGMNARNIITGSYGGTRGAVNFAIADLCARIHANGVRLIVAISHIKPSWGPGGQRLPNKYDIKGADKWQELSILSLVLVPGEFAPIPAALVRKEQLASVRYTPDDPGTDDPFAIRRRLPARIPRCTFHAIRSYLSHPADLAHPAPGETPGTDESAPFDERLSREQIEFLTQALKSEERRLKDEVEAERELATIVDSEMVARARELKAQDGLSNRAIAEQLGVSVPELLRMLQ